MARDTQGNYSLPSGTLVNSGDTVLPSQHDPAMQDIAAALTGSLARSGVGGMLAALNMNGNSVQNINNVEAQGTVTATGDLTGANLNIATGGQAKFGSANFFAQVIGGRPTLYFDASNNHYIQYDPTADHFRFVLHGAVLANLKSNGDLVLLGSVIQNGGPS